MKKLFVIGYRLGGWHRLLLSLITINLALITAPQAHAQGNVNVTNPTTRPVPVNVVSGTAATAAGEAHIGQVGGHVARVSASFTRPADTTAYASGDLVANSTTAGSVAPMSFAISRATGKGGMVRRARLRKSGTSVTNASFRIHLYTLSPTLANGDNAAWSSNGVANYVGAIDVTVDKAFTDGAAGNGVPNTGSEINFTSDTYYAVVEARGAYTPVSGETFSVELEILQN